MYYKLSVFNITKITFLTKFRYFRNSTNNFTPPIRSDLFRGHGWNSGRWGEMNSRAIWVLVIFKK